MEEKLEKILEKLSEIKSNMSDGILLFACFISCCMTCNYMQEMKEEQHKTNIYLKMVYNRHNQDSTNSLNQLKNN